MAEIDCVKSCTDITPGNALKKRAKILGKWLWILFWIIIAGNIVGFVNNEMFANLFPGLQRPGQILSLCVSIGCGLIYIRLKSQNARYAKVGIITLISGFLSPLNNLLQENVMEPVPALLMSIGLVGISLYCTYLEYTAHAEVLEGADQGLAEKWCRLWTWEIILLGVTLGGIVVAMLIPLLGLLAGFAGAIGMVVVTVLRIVYLYKTAQFFRGIAADL